MGVYLGLVFGLNALGFGLNAGMFGGAVVAVIAATVVTECLHYLEMRAASRQPRETEGDEKHGD